MIAIVSELKKDQIEFNAELGQENPLIL